MPGNGIQVKTAALNNRAQIIWKTLPVISEKNKGLDSIKS